MLRAAVRAPFGAAVQELMSRASLISGSLFALAAGLMWGLVFVGPLLLPEYPAAIQSFGRYLAFGLIALPLARNR